MSTLRQDTLNGVRGALEVSLKWIEHAFPTGNTLDEERSIEAIVNPIKSALLATKNFERKIKSYESNEGS